MASERDTPAAFAHASIAAVVDHPVRWRARSAQDIMELTRMMDESRAQRTGSSESIGALWAAVKRVGGPVHWL